jgi:hypothetical protein
MILSRPRELTLLLLLSLAACEETTSMVEPPPGEASFARATPSQGSSQRDWLEALKAVTARYHSTTQAQAAGYVREDICVADSQLGGMGYHWANPSLVDPIFDPLEPEVVLYERKANGGFRLVALEYVVIDVGQPTPEFAGHPFDVGGVPPLTAAGVEHWSLHVWLYEENPHGVHAPFNPRVSCP